MADFEKLVERVINSADILLMVIDARKIDECINKKIVAKINQRNKKIIYVLNKCDLLSESELKKIRLTDSVKISATNHRGTMKLLRKIMVLGKGKEVTVGVVGLPNTGKSSLINALKGKHSAPTSSISGFTRGIQKLRINKKIMMIDTPGVFSNTENEVILVSIGAIDADKIKDAEIYAINLISTLNGKIEEYFSVTKHEDALETLENIAIKKHILRKGGLPDTERMGRQIVWLCQKGKIK